MRETLQPVQGKQNKALCGPNLRKEGREEGMSHGLPLRQLIILQRKAPFGAEGQWQASSLLPSPQLKVKRARRWSEFIV